MLNLKSHKELTVWQKSMDLVENIYKLTESFPKSEAFGLISQMRRAVVGIPSNIAEGYQRNSTKEYINFLYISRATASELETQLILSKRLEYINQSEFTNIEELLVQVLKMLNTLITKLKSKSQILNPIP